MASTCRRILYLPFIAWIMWIIPRPADAVVCTCVITQRVSTFCCVSLKVCCPTTKTNMRWKPVLVGSGKDSPYSLDGWSSPLYRGTGYKGPSEGPYILSGGQVWSGDPKKGQPIYSNNGYDQGYGYQNAYSHQSNAVGPLPPPPVQQSSYTSVAAGVQYGQSTQVATYNGPQQNNANFPRSTADVKQPNGAASSYGRQGFSTRDGETVSFTGPPGDNPDRPHRSERMEPDQSSTLQQPPPTPEMKTLAVTRITQDPRPQTTALIRTDPTRETFPTSAFPTQPPHPSEGPREMGPSFQALGTRRMEPPVDESRHFHHARQAPSDQKAAAPEGTLPPSGERTYYPDQAAIVENEPIEGFSEFLR